MMRAAVLQEVHGVSQLGCVQEWNLGASLPSDAFEAMRATTSSSPRPAPGRAERRETAGLGEQGGVAGACVSFRP